jgi:hypothetical protein
MCFSAHRDIFRLVLYYTSYIFAAIYRLVFALIGAIAVVSLMTGHVVDRMSVQSTTNTFTSNATLQTASIGAIDPASAITVATTLAFTVGLIQVWKAIDIYRKNRQIL